MGNVLFLTKSGTADKLKVPPKTRKDSDRDFSILNTFALLDGWNFLHDVLCIISIQ